MKIQKGNISTGLGANPSAAERVTFTEFPVCLTMLWSETPLPDSDLTVPIGTEKEASPNTAGHIYTYWNCSNLLHSELCSPF